MIFSLNLLSPRSGDGVKALLPHIVDLCELRRVDFYQKHLFFMSTQIFEGQALIYHLLPLNPIFHQNILSSLITVSILVQNQNTEITQPEKIFLLLI